MATLQGQPLLPSVALSSCSALKGLALSRPGRAAPSDPPQSPPGPLPPLCHCGSRPTGNPSTSRKPPCGGSHARQGHHLWPACKSTPKPLSCVRKEGDCGTASRPNICPWLKSEHRAGSLLGSPQVWEASAHGRLELRRKLGRVRVLREPYFLEESFGEGKGVVSLLGIWRLQAGPASSPAAGQGGPSTPPKRNFLWNDDLPVTCDLFLASCLTGPAETD